jgi:hypothetical protein
LQPQPLKSLSEHLLRAGVAHRHVRRYVRELHEHYEDAVREELAKGLDRSLAEQTAWARLGNEEELARSVLAQPTLRSTAARFPVLVFGAAPALIWLTSLALSLFGLFAFVESYEQPAFWVLESTYALLLVYMRVLPVLLGVLLLIASVRQRMAPYLADHWHGDHCSYGRHKSHQSHACRHSGSEQRRRGFLAAAADFSVLSSAWTPECPRICRRARTSCPDGWDSCNAVCDLANSAEPCKHCYLIGASAV